MYQLLVTFALCFVLVGCAPNAGVPPYLALVTPAFPGMSGSCTGFVVAPKQVVTAKHCVATAKRIVTANGQEAWIASVRVSAQHDIAILTTEQVLWVAQFAALGHPALGRPAQIWGFCPYQISFVPRHALYNGLVETEIQNVGHDAFGEWLMPAIPGANNTICPGDSGGPIVQDGKVVGVVSGGYIPVWFVALATRVYATRVDVVEEMVED